jgi:hypothetical protein
LAAAKEFITIFDDLMRSTDQVNIVFDGEFAHDALTESEADTSIVFTELFDPSFWV